MTQLQHWAMDPFDIMWKNFFDTTSTFNSIKTKINYPVDIYETETGLRFELAVVGLEKKDLKIQVEGNTLRVIHDGPGETESREYIQRGIARRSFDLAWRVADKYNLAKLEAKMEKGLLILDVPAEKTKILKEITIN
jgi:HSP20 family molecular chaperone IbpA